MATWSGQVASSGDDARNVNGDGTFNSTGATFHLGQNAGVDYWCGWRWNNVAVAQGATVTSATLDLYSAGVGTGSSASVIFYGNDVDDAAAFANNTANKPEGKTRTTATTSKTFTPSAWTATGFGIDLVDVTTIVQEILDRGGWVSGNDMIIVGHNNGSANNNYIGHSTYDSNSTRGATLTINYTAGSPPTAPSSLSGTQDGNDIDLTWTDNASNETEFILERKRGGSSNYYEIARPAANATSYTDTDVDAGYTYTYRIKATNADGDSSYATSSAVAMTGTKAWTAYSMGWIYPGSPAEDADEEYRDGRVIHFLKPEYYRVDASGDLDQVTDPADGENAYSSGNVADVKNYSDYQFVTVASNHANMATLLGNGTKEAAAISTLVTFCVDNGFTGVELDWEGFGDWTPTDYSDYIAFVTDLGAALHAEGKLLMIDCPPITNLTEQGYYEFAYKDFESITEVDYLCMMLYDYQYDYGSPSSVQPATWAQNGCAWVRSKISDIDRIVIGIPNYGYHATTASPYTITIDTKDQSAVFTGYSGATRNADDEMQWTNSGTEYTYQDSAGINTKRERIEDEGIKYVSTWHLGGNDWYTGKDEIPRSTTPAENTTNFFFM